MKLFFGYCRFNNSNLEICENDMQEGPQDLGLQVAVVDSHISQEGVEVGVTCKIGNWSLWAKQNGVVISSPQNTVSLSDVGTKVNLHDFFEMKYVIVSHYYVK